MGKQETQLYEPEERLHSSSRGIKTTAFFLEGVWQEQQQEFPCLVVRFFSNLVDESPTIHGKRGMI